MAPAEGKVSLNAFPGVDETRRKSMVRKYSKAASAKVKKVMCERKQGTLKSGSTGKAVKSRQQPLLSGSRRHAVPVKKYRTKNRASSVSRQADVTG
jgi:hypothetical protein